MWFYHFQNEKQSAYNARSEKKTAARPRLELGSPDTLLSAALHPACAQHMLQMRGDDRTAHGKGRWVLTKLPRSAKKKKKVKKLKKSHCLKLKKENQRKRES